MVKAERPSGRRMLSTTCDSSENTRANIARDSSSRALGRDSPVYAMVRLPFENCYCLDGAAFFVDLLDKPEVELARARFMREQ